MSTTVKKEVISWVKTILLAAVLAGLTVSEIAVLAGRWREFDRKENPSAAGTAEELENVKKN